uniref:Eukaryotic translation initiation factor 3 subunit K n=1 Tax=Parascaris univalens TaxID=6257 RepID=A0A915AR21_PARUN
MDGLQIGLESPPQSPSSPSSNGEANGLMQTSGVPCLTIRDSPDMSVRAVFQDFSGCKILNAETLLQMATRIGYCKASHLFVNFEVRTTDRYQLPFTNRDLFHLTQVCDELFVKLVPSLDLQSNYIEPDAARRLVECFLDDFPLSKVAHFGPNLASILIANRTILHGIQRRVTRIYLSYEIDEKNAAVVNELPPYVTLCIEGRYPFEVEALISSRLNVVLRFATSDPGYLCAAPESIAKKAILAAKLGDKFPVLGTMICELSTGCEIMPPSLSYMPEVASVGVSWNKRVDMKRFCFLLPRITAEHFLLDGNMEALFKQASTLGRVEHEITRFSYGLLRPLSNGPSKDFLSTAMSKKTPISVFVEMILNPDNMVLERLTPVIFKKARIELRRSLKALDEARKLLPYNFELALVLAEIQLVTELMVLATRLGQLLCMHGVNPSLVSNSTINNSVSRRKASAESHPIIGYNMVNVGVANLPLTARTDLANSLLDIRAKFQHTWLSRNIASTLPNALKIFDNLFRALLPPSMQDYGKNLL